MGSIFSVDSWESYLGTENIYVRGMIDRVRLFAPLNIAYSFGVKKVHKTCNRARLWIKVFVKSISRDACYVSAII